MRIRNFRAEDLTEIVNLWNKSLKNKPQWYVENNLLTKEKLENIVSDPDFDPKGTFVSYDKQIIGFSRGVVRKVKSHEKIEEPGWLEGLVVEPSFVRRGIGTELLQNVESYIKTKGENRIRVGQSILPETPEYKFLLNKGFKPKHFEIQLRLIFEDFTWRDKIQKIRERLKQKCIEIKYYEDKYKQSFSRLMEKYFQGWWRSIYKPNLERDQPLPFLIAADKDKVVGFIGFVNVKNKRAAFSPGVKPEYRNRGIGKTLVNLWAKEVKKIGAEESFISTGSENYPAQHIYFDMGYKKVGTFCTELIKDLKV